MIKFFKIICLITLCFTSVVSKASSEDNSSWGNSISEHFYADEVVEDTDDYETSFFTSFNVRSIIDPDSGGDGGNPVDPDPGDDPDPAPIDDYIPLLIIVGLVIGYTYKKKIFFKD